jgi:CelD/BcsL family acetyltransferase involved in cellulose biosynthesis
MSIAQELETDTEQPTAERVTVGRTIEEVEALRETWSRAGLTDLDADLDWFLTVIRNRDEAQRPHVVLIERPDRPDLLAVARIEHFRLESRIGYRVFARPRVRCLFVVSGGIAGVQDDEDRRRLLEELQRPLRDGEADLLLLAKLDVDDPLAAMARSAGPRVCRDPAPALDSRRSIAIPDDLEAFIAARSSKTRRNTRYYDRRFTKAHPAATVREVREEAELEALCADVEAVAAKTYQRGLGAAFTGDALDRALMRLSMRRGTFRAWVLDLDGAPIAFWFGTAHQGTFGLAHTGYDPAYAGDRVGVFLFVRAVEALCAEPGIERLDWGYGDSELKRTYSDQCREVADVLLFAATPRAIRINLVRMAIDAIARTARRLVAESDLGRRLKRAWRDRLARSA